MWPEIYGGGGRLSLDGDRSICKPGLAKVCTRSPIFFSPSQNTAHMDHGLGEGEPDGDQAHVDDAVEDVETGS